MDLKIQCGYCGTYTPTDAELKDIYHQSMFTDYTCLRCNDEVYVLINDRRAITTTDIRNAIDIIGD